MFKDSKCAVVLYIELILDNDSNKSPVSWFGIESVYSRTLNLYIEDVHSQICYEIFKLQQYR